MGQISDILKQHYLEKQAQGGWVRSPGLEHGYTPGQEIGGAIPSAPRTQVGMDAARYRQNVLAAQAQGKSLDPRMVGRIKQTPQPPVDKYQKVRQALAHRGSQARKGMGKAYQAAKKGAGGLGWGKALKYGGLLGGGLLLGNALFGGAPSQQPAYNQMYAQRYGVQY